LRSLYEIAEEKKVTVSELTGTRRKYSKVKLPERVARAFGYDDNEEAEIIIEHYDEGISSAEIPYIAAFWDIKREEEERRNK
jgi:hypothetical protein